MPDIPVPPAAVQIAAGALRQGSTRNAGVSSGRDVVVALARTGWLHDPDSYSERSRASVVALVKRQAVELAALRAVADAVERYLSSGRSIVGLRDLYAAREALVALHTQGDAPTSRKPC